MRERMYLETMQEIFTRASKVLVDAGGSNPLLYLPIDKIIQQAAQDAGKAPAPASSSTSLPGASQPTVPALPRPSTGSSGGGNALTRDRSAR